MVLLTSTRKKRKFSERNVTVYTVGRTAPSLAVKRFEKPCQGFTKQSSSINIHNNIIMKFGTPATQALIAFASVALLSSLRTASAAPLPVCDSPTTPIDNEGAVLVRFWNELVKSKNEIGADCPFECGDGEFYLLVFLLSSSL